VDKGMEYRDERYRMQQADLLKKRVIKLGPKFIEARAT
jgi:hypothetical protein